MNHTYKILKYLYQNNDGHFQDIQKAYCRNYIPSDLFFANKIMELVKLQLIESRCFYENRELFSMDRDTQILTISINKPESLQARITSKGEGYIDENTIKFFSWIVNKRNFMIYMIGAIVTIITFLINLIICH